MFFVLRFKSVFAHQEVLDWIAAESSGDHTIEIVTDNMLDQVKIIIIFTTIFNWLNHFFTDSMLDQASRAL